MNPLLVFVGGGLGAMARWSFGTAFLRLAGPDRPWLATLCINVLGGLFMGLLIGALAARAQGGVAAERLRLLVGVGVLGGFTTFSTYSLEVALLIQRKAYATALGYAAGSAALAVAAVFLGLMAVRRLSPMSGAHREVRSLTVGDAEAGVRLDRWFKRRWPHLNHIQINKLVRSGQVRVDGGRAKVDARLESGAVVRVPPLPEAPAAGERPAISDRDIALAKSLVLYEDEEVLVLNKPSGLAVQGGTKTSRHVDRLLSAWGEGLNRPRLTHRLDRDTSGVLILGRTPAAAARLSGAFAKRKARKTYWALVAGQPKPAEGLIQLPLVKKGVGDRELVVPADPKELGAEAADTEFVTLSWAGARVSWMALRPLTGRTHQLRAHMKAIGHPILGDPKYGDEASASLSAGLKLQLHARRLEIPHPSRGTLILEAPISPELHAGFARFGFDEHEADPEPFARLAKGRRR